MILNKLINFILVIMTCIISQVHFPWSCMFSMALIMKLELSKQFDIKDFGNPHNFLGIEVVYYLIRYILFLSKNISNIFEQIKLIFLILEHHTHFP